MGPADPGGPGPDLYRLLGVTRSAPREEIVQAWRRRARAEHPDSRPGDAAAAARFRALAGAWHVLGDPARRAAYDRALAVPPQAPGLDQRAEAEVRFAVLAELAARIVFGNRDWPW
jgi:curved DNA-binding protein CbpA